MKQLLFVLGALAPLCATACKGPETHTEVKDAASVTLVVSGMT